MVSHLGLFIISVSLSRSLGDDTDDCSVLNFMAPCHLEKMGHAALSQAWKSDSERATRLLSSVSLPECSSYHHH